MTVTIPRTEATWRSEEKSATRARDWEKHEEWRREQDTNNEAQ